jgi:hypothetical protein
MSISSSMTEMKITKMLVMTKISIEIVWLRRQIAFFDLFSLCEESFMEITAKD